MRPGVLSCTAENMTIANRNITSPVVAIPMKVVHDTPCYGDTAETTVTAVSEELINLQADATDPPLLCINSGPYTVSVSVPRSPFSFIYLRLDSLILTLSFILLFNLFVAGPGIPLR